VSFSYKHSITESGIALIVKLYRVANQEKKWRARQTPFLCIIRLISSTTNQ